MLLLQKFKKGECPLVLELEASRRMLDLNAPAADGWTDEDLAVMFASAPRWGGLTVWPLSLSMAQHALAVTVLYERAFRKQGLIAPNAALLLGVLLQDAERAFLSKFEKVCHESFAEMSRESVAIAHRIRVAINRRYGLTPRSTVERVLHLHADQQASASEAIYVAGWQSSDVVEYLRIGIPPMESDPLTEIYGGIDWQPWPVQLSAARFLSKLQELQSAASRSN